ncbi:MAG: TIGR03086 family metal-binding protein [Acidimicrobiia bacterium]
MELNDFFNTVTSATSRVMGAVQPGDGRPTPCTEWVVDDLVGHIFAVSGQAKAMAAGVDVAIHGSEPDVVGADIGASYRDSVESVRAAFADPAMMTKTLATPMGPHPGRVVFTVTSLEHLVHGWDLASAVDSPYQIADDVGEFALSAVESMPEVFDQFRQWNVYAPPLTDETDAGPGARLLALLGRDPAWRPAPRPLG